VVTAISGAAYGSKILKKTRMFLLVVFIDGVSFIETITNEKMRTKQQKLPTGGLEKSHSRDDLENPPT